MDSLAKLLLLVIAASMFIALMKGGFTGPGGLTAWFKAKFLGRVSA